MIILIAVIALTATAWFWPRVGGIALLAAGTFAVVLIRNPWAFSLLALPAIVVGIVLFLVKGRART